MQVEDSFRKKCRFELSLRYELFYSLNALLDPNSRIHSGWRKTTQKNLGSPFAILIEKVGNSWEIWPALAALMPGSLANPSFEDILESIRKLPIESFKEKILRGLIHSEAALDPLIKGRVSLRAALGKVPKTKREWISHIGLFPYDTKSAQVIALEKLIAEPKAFRAVILQVLDFYWQKSFRLTWERLQSQFKQSLEARERLFHSCSFSEFSKQALLRIEVDEQKNVIAAVRGGYRLKFQEVQSCYFLPSAFNDRRFWSAFKDDGKKTVVYFPYFDPAITLDLQIAGQSVSLSEPSLDAALIFKALGDSTRFAMAMILARTPTSSVELSKILSVSKPTVSHHVHLLREAGLLQENYVNGSIELQLKREVLESLSKLTIEKLFEGNEPLTLVRTRGKA